MRIGLFTDTYFPQVSGVATSIRTLKEELEELGHEVYIFTTTDKAVGRYEDPTIIRLPSVPFVSFTDRRVVYRGLMTSYRIAKAYQLDIIHTQTEFGMGNLGKLIGKALRIPVVHTYHTQYEDYVDYIAKGKIIRPGMVKYIVRGYLNNLDGIICPSRIVTNLLEGYEVKPVKRTIPTGIQLDQFVRDDISQEDVDRLRQDLGFQPCDTMLLSLSRISSEKNIQAILASLPEVLSEYPHVKLVVVGDGPYLTTLKQLTTQLGLEASVIFTGMIDHNQVALYYKACDFFISASTSETQGLTYTEALASGKPVIAHGNPYLDDLITDKMFGTLYYDARDLPAAIIDALVSTPEMTQKHLTQKLNAISAQQFGKAVYSFYLDAIIAKAACRQYKYSLTMEGSPADRSLQLVKQTAVLPVTLVKKTATTSAKVFKAPIKVITSIKDFLE
ncbi:glycosyltransferase family 4 protein [Streptococcus sp. E17BB]|uniref:glycosyltransferase family 4 protein n=1 Tax=Streptococcus sp. E17BB TaxID=3278714 RepID=UPI00359DEB8E